MRLIDAISARDSFEDNLAYMGSEVKRILNIAPTVEAEPVVYCWQCANRGTEECPMRWTVYATEDDEGYYEVEIPYDETKTWGFCHKGKVME